MIRTAFGATSTADDVLAGVDLSGRVALVTGASSGIGIPTARALAAAGARVVLAVRDTVAGARIAQEIGSATGNENLAVVRLDLADPASVDAVVAAWSGPLDILVANAGVMATPELRTPQGWELQFATNHLGHFALTTGLRRALAISGRSRIVAVSSVGHVNGGVLFDDLMFDHHPYDPWAAYSQSKTANVLFAVEAARRWASDGIAVNALNPGRIAATGLSRHVDPVAVAPVSFDPSGTTGVSVKNVEQGAATSVLLAGSPLVEGVTGTYFEDCQEAEPFTPGVRRGVAAHALDPDAAKHLWQVSMTLLEHAREGGTPG